MSYESISCTRVSIFAKFTVIDDDFITLTSLYNRLMGILSVRF